MDWTDEEREAVRGTLDAHEVTIVDDDDWETKGFLAPFEALWPTKRILDTLAPHIEKRVAEAGTVREEGLVRIVDDLTRTTTASHREALDVVARATGLIRAEAEVARLTATLDKVRALADKWETEEAYACRNAGDCIRCVTYQGAVIRLRAALDEGSDQ